MSPNDSPGVRPGQGGAIRRQRAEIQRRRTVSPAEIRRRFPFGSSAPRWE